MSLEQYDGVVGGWKVGMAKSIQCDSGWWVWGAESEVWGVGPEFVLRVLRRSVGLDD